MLCRKLSKSNFKVNNLIDLHLKVNQVGLGSTAEMSDQYLTTGIVSATPIHTFKRYEVIKSFDQILEFLSMTLTSLCRWVGTVA